MDALHKKIEDISQSFFEVKSDMGKISLLVDRLDVTIEKLTEVSSNISQLLAVQGSRLEYQEKNYAMLQAMFEKRKLETDSAMEKLNIKIDNVEKEIEEDMIDTKNSICNQIRELESTIKSEYEKQSIRISRLERWFLIIGGGAATILFAFKEIPSIISTIATLF